MHDDRLRSARHDKEVRDLLAADRPVLAHEASRCAGSDTLASSTAARLWSALRDQGYLERALAVARELADHSPRAARTVAELSSELRVLRAEVTPEVPAAAGPFAAVPPRVLHVLSTSQRPGPEPWLQSMTSFEREQGLRPSVVTEMGFLAGRTDLVQEVDGLPHHRIPGASRDRAHAERWYSAHVSRLARVVRKVRPASLVASGDHLTDRAAILVGHAYGVPVLLHRHGSYAEEWLTNATVTFGWPDVDELEATWGLPDVYVLLRDGERRLRAEADRVVGGEPTPEMALLRAFEETRVVSPGTCLLTCLGAHTRDLDRLRAQIITSATLRPLESEMRGDPSLAEDIEDRGWGGNGFAVVGLEHPVDWTTLCLGNRSQGFFLHAWDFMRPALARYSDEQQIRYLEWCVGLAVSWCSTFDSCDGRGTMAWYDMALALRAPKLAFLLQEALVHDLPAETLTTLHAGVVLHQQQLIKPTSFVAHNNHGFYTAVGQLALARRLSALPGMSELHDQGSDRLRTVMDTQFADDGGHLEHSPDYHRMLTGSFAAAIAEGVIDDPEVQRRVTTAYEVMGWFLRPDGTLVQIGDSPERLLTSSDLATRAPHTTFLVTGGEAGTPNHDTLKVLPQAGYAFVRSPQPVIGSDHTKVCYLSFMAGFHSRAHKHADDLSLTWFDRGHELLIDAGRFGFLEALPTDSPQRLDGFYYGRPERQYVESTRAHNTVGADSRDHERRSREPYGSALVGGWKEASHYRLVGQVDHGAWRHRREVVLRPGAWLWVRDEVTATDGSPHDFRVWWNLPESLAAVAQAADSRSITFTGDGPSSGATLTITSLDGAEVIAPVAGQRDPLRGWRSRVDYELTPAWSAGFGAYGCEQHVFDTVLTLDGIQAHDIPANPWHQRGTAGATPSRS